MRKIEKLALGFISENYGLDHQLEKLREELQEAVDAVEDFLLKHSMPYNMKCKSASDVLEELGDVENMIYQVKGYLSEEELKKYKEMRAGKIVRQLKRIMEESGVKDE